MSLAMADSEQKAAVPSYWECPVCSNWVSIYVRPTVPPYCNNPRHSTKVPEMIEKTPPRGRIKK